MKTRNKGPRNKKKDDYYIEVVKVMPSIVSEKNVETLWKLYRNVGETVEDVKHRLLDSLENNINLSAEFCGKIDNSVVESEQMHVCSSNESTEDEDLESENESTVTEEEDEEEEGEGEDGEITEEERNEIKEMECVKSEFADGDDSGFGNSLYLGDILDIDLQESDKLFDISSDWSSDNMKEECKDWTFNSCSTDSFESASNCTYDVPRLKRITNAELVADEFTLIRKNAESNEVAAEVGKVSQRRSEINKPMICDMYGVRTINYNYFEPEVKIPDNFKISKLSDSSNDEELELSEKSSFNTFAAKLTAVRMEGTDFIVSSNRFRNKNKRKRAAGYDDFWHSFAVNLSSDSDTNEDLINECKSKKQRLLILPGDGQNKSISTSDTSSSSSCTCSRSSCSCSATSSDSNDEQDDS